MHDFHSRATTRSDKLQYHTGLMHKHVCVETYVMLAINKFEKNAKANLVNACYKENAK